MNDNPSGAADSIGRLLGPSISSGLINGLLNTVRSISLAAVICHGETAGYLPYGTAFMLAGAFVTTLVIGLFSSSEGVIATPSTGPTVIVALMAASLYSSISTSGNPQQFLPTLTAAVMIGSILTGILLTAIGYFRMGDLMRYIPYPVIAGFLGGCGVLLVAGSFPVATGLRFEPGNVPLFFQPDIIKVWLAGLLLSLLFFAVSYRWKHFLLLPATLAFSIILFYVVLGLTGTSPEQARAGGWLFESFSGGLRPPEVYMSLTNVQWSLLFGETGHLLSLAAVCVVDLLLCAAAIEIATDKTLDLNRELRVAGIANTAAGAAGGTIGYHAVVNTVLEHKLGAVGRWGAVFTAAFCGAVLFMGASALSYFPKPVVAGFILYMGLSFVYDWVWAARARLPLLDYCLVVAIVIIIATFGFLQGVTAGIIIALVMFVVKYSRLEIVRLEMTGKDHSSNMERAPLQKGLLSEKGRLIHILVLQGFIFFGTSERLLIRIRERLDTESRGPLEYMVIDFSWVSRMDYSAVLGFAKITRLLREQGITLVLTALGREPEQCLEQSGCLAAPNLIRHADLDRGLEWCEDMLLKDDTAIGATNPSITTQLEELFNDTSILAPFLAYLERIDIRPGDYLFREGDPPENLFFVESGKLTVFHEQKDGGRKRLRAFGAGTVVGEMGLYLDAPRSATVIAEEPGVLYRLSGESFREMQKNDPRVASVFNEFIVRLLASRLVHTGNELKLSLS